MLWFSFLEAVDSLCFKLESFVTRRFPPDQRLPRPAVPYILFAGGDTRVIIPCRAMLADIHGRHVPGHVFVIPWASCYGYGRRCLTACSFAQVLCLDVYWALSSSYTLGPQGPCQSYILFCMGSIKASIMGSFHFLLHYPNITPIYTL